MAASSSKNLPALMPSKAKSGTALVDEKIDEKILRLLGLEDVFDIDYDTYSSLLREKMAAARMANKTLPTEEIEMITNEWKRIKGKKGRFKVKKITAASFKKGSAVGINLKKQKLLLGAKPLALKPATDQLGPKSDIKEIIDVLGEIIKNLALQNKNQKDSNEKRRKNAEAEKRGLAESALEKGFKGAIKVAEKIIAPIKSLLGRIIDYFTAIFLGRVVFKLLEWFGNPDNAEKIKSIGRFLGDHWPKLLSLYLLFGTQFGGFVRSLISLLVKGGAALLRAALGLAAKAGLSKAGKVAKFLGGKKGKLLVSGVEAAATVGATMALSSGIENFGGIGEPKSQGFSGGGYVKPKFPAFSGGGFSGGLGSLGDLLSGLGKSQGMLSGFVSGEKGVDKIPAMLSDGEFVMSRGAVAKYGVDTLEAMNAAGGGTNKPKIMSGTTYAQGGGLIGDGTEDYKKEKVKDPILEKRKKTITSQLQAQKAISSGSGLNIKGASTGRQLGKGYGATHQGRDAIVIKGGAAKMDLSINIAGKQYYGMKRGNDAVYTAIDNRDRGTGGFLQPGGLLGGPRMSSRMDYAQSKGKYYSSSDQKTYGNYNDAMAAKKSRMASLASQQRLDKLSSVGANRSSRGIRFESESMARGQEIKNRGGVWGQISRGWMNAFGSDKDRQNIAAQDKESLARIKQAGAASIGRYYSSSDGKYYKDYNAATQARKSRELELSKSKTAKISPSKPQVKAVTPPAKPSVVVKSKYSGGQRGSGSKPSTGGSPKTPVFGATCPSSNARKNKKILGIF